jgi:hypothetical protein
MTFTSVFQDAVANDFIAVHTVTQGFALFVIACTAKDYKLEKRLLFWPFKPLRIPDRPFKIRPIIL